MCGILSETRVNVSTTDATTVCIAAPCGKKLKLKLKLWEDGGFY